MKSSEYLYRPQHKNRNELINDFVIRNSIYDRILHSIETEVSSEASQHILIEGKRGMGKTTLMLRLTYELQNKEELKKKFVPCKFNEEEYGIANLSILWERIAEHLEEDERFDGIIDIFDDIEGKNDEEKFISEVLKWLEEQDVIAIVFIDNFFQIIEKFTPREQQRLREVLIKTPYIKIIAGSARFLERNVGDYASPFFEFFKREKLNKLDEKETKELLIHLAEKHNAQNVIDTINNEPQRIANIRILCGGVPRTLVTFFEVLMDDANGNSIDDLKLVMDRTNELYLQRMNSLSNKEQPIIHAMALHWEAISTGELAEKVGEKSGTISAMLTKLSKQQIIEKVKTDTKNHLWRIEERFFNIWYLMTQAPRRYQRKVKWLTAFIETVYDEKLLHVRIDRHLDFINTENTNTEYALLLTQALSSVKFISMERRDELIQETKKKYDQSLMPRTFKEIKDKIASNIIEENYKNAKIELEEIPSANLRSLYSEVINTFKDNPIKSQKETVRQIDFRATLFLFFRIFNLGGSNSDIEGRDSLKQLWDVEKEAFEACLKVYSKNLKNEIKPEIPLLSLIILTEFNRPELALEIFLACGEAGNPMGYSMAGIVGELINKHDPVYSGYLRKSLTKNDPLGILFMTHKVVENGSPEELKEYVKTHSKTFNILLEASLTGAFDSILLPVFLGFFMNKDFDKMALFGKRILLSVNGNRHNHEIVITLLSAAKMNNFLLTTFEEYPHLKDQLKVPYYAILYELNEVSLKKKIQAMPPELNEPLDIFRQQIALVRAKNFSS